MVLLMCSGVNIKLHISMAEVNDILQARGQKIRNGTRTQLSTASTTPLPRTPPDDMVGVIGPIFGVVFVPLYHRSLPNFYVQGTKRYSRRTVGRPIACRLVVQLIVSHCTMAGFRA